MGNPGLGVMIAMLGGNEDSVKTFQEHLGAEIASLGVHGESLEFSFADGRKMALKDEGQSCCESRYMTTDDDLSYFVGSKLIAADTRDAPSGPLPYEGGEHDVQFLVVKTSKGEFTVSSHNEHNGYYGGFAIRAVEI